MLRLPFLKLGPIEEGGSLRCIGDVVGKSATEVGKSTEVLKLLCNKHASDRSEMFGELGFDHIQHARIGGIYRASSLSWRVGSSYVAMQRPNPVRCRRGQIVCPRQKLVPLLSVDDVSRQSHAERCEISGSFALRA